MVSIDFSDDTTLYIAIGAGVAVILVVLLCCCCCCRRKKSKANALAETPVAAPAVASVPPELPDGMSHKQTSHLRPPSQKSYVVDIDSSSASENYGYHEYARMPTSPGLDAPIAATVLEHPPHYYQHQQQKAAVFEAPSLVNDVSPMTTTAPNSVERTLGSSDRPVRAMAHNSNSSGRSAQHQTDIATLADDPVIVASRLPFDTITAVRLISKGGFGEVHRGLYRGNTVAIKRLLPETRRDLKQIRSFFEEVKIMATMEHPHIVHFIGVAWDSYSDMSVVIEFMEGGDLRAALNEFDTLGRPLGFDKQKATIALHVAHALTYMHSLQPMVLHRDLKSKNILLDESQTVAKLTDFGVSRERSDATMTGGVGTLLWMAPEVMAGERYDEKADVFSFGIVLSELDTYAMPYSDIKARLAVEEGRKLPDTALVQRIMTGRLRVSFSGALRPDVRALGERCILLDPRERPTAAQVLYELQKIQRTMASEISIVL